MPAVTRKQYKGAAAQTTITNALASGDTSITIAATTGWPDGATPYFIVISPGTASEEKCLVTRSGSTLTLTRAQDDTTAQSHASGATTYPVFAADDADETNKLASTLTTRGDLLTMDSGPDFKRLAVGSANTFLKSNGTDPSWAAITEPGLVLISSTTIGSAATTVTVSGAFSSTYDNYRITISGGTVNTDTSLEMLLGATTTGYYQAGKVRTFAGADLNVDNENIGGWFLGDCSTKSLAYTIDLFGPNLANETWFSASSIFMNTTTGHSLFQTGFVDNTTSYTAFTINVNGGHNATGGTIKVYGYRN
jgi:hypothetical protein